MIRPWVATILSLITIGVSLWLVCYGLRRASQAKRRWYQAMAQDHWWQAIEEFFSLVLEDRIDAHSATFRVIFRMQLLATDEQNAARVAEELEALFRPVQGALPSWLAERADWPIGVWSVLERMAEASHLLAATQPGWAAVLVRWRLWRIRQGPHSTPTNLRSPATVPAIASLRTMLSLLEASHRLHALAQTSPRPALTVMRP